MKYYLIFLLLIISCSKISKNEIINFYKNNSVNINNILKFKDTNSINLSYQKIDNVNFRFKVFNGKRVFISFNKNDFIQKINKYEFSKINRELYLTLLNLLENSKFDYLEYNNEKNEAFIELIASQFHHLIITENMSLRNLYSIRNKFLIIDSLSFCFDYNGL
jgi:hypothetical protein